MMTKRPEDEPQTEEEPLSDEDKQTLEDLEKGTAIPKDDSD